MVGLVKIKYSVGYLIVWRLRAINDATKGASIVSNSFKEIAWESSTLNTNKQTNNKPTIKLKVFQSLYN